MPKLLGVPTLIISLIFSILGCGLSRKNVIGIWREQYGNTLIINNDNSFQYKREVNQKYLDSISKPDLLGKWTLSKKIISFKFTDTTQDFWGGCRFYEYWWFRGSKKKLIRPMDCKRPTNRFVTITKME